MEGKIRVKYLEIFIEFLKIEGSVDFFLKKKK